MDEDRLDASGGSPRAAARRVAEASRHREDLLDAALAESFPASDPPSIVQPGG